MPAHRKKTRSKRQAVGEEPSGDDEKDRRIADGAIAALRWLTTVREGAVRIAVESGDLTLRGTVQDLNQKSFVEEIVGKQPGVKNVRNHLRISEEMKEIAEPLSDARWQTDFFAQLYDGSD